MPHMNKLKRFGEFCLFREDICEKSLCSRIVNECAYTLIQPNTVSTLLLWSSLQYTVFLFFP